MRFRLPLLAFLLLSAPPAAPAQTPAPVPHLPPPRHEGSAELAFVGTSGNSSTQTIGAGSEFIYRAQPWQSKVTLNYVRNRADGKLTAESFAFALRGERPLRDGYSGYGEYSYQRDHFAGIRNRNAVDSGVAYRLVDRASQTLTVDGAFGYAHESRVTGATLSTATVTAGAEYKRHLTATSEVAEEGRLVAAPARATDWRYKNVASLSTKVAAFWSLKVSNTVSYVHFLAPGFENTDVRTSIALVAKF
jgi:putative salt-induced outer membrane protein YdiY